MSFEISDDAMLVSFMLATGFLGLTAVISETFGGPPEPAFYAPMMLFLIMIAWAVLDVLEWIGNLVMGDSGESEESPEPADYPTPDGGHDGKA